MPLGQRTPGVYVIEDAGGSQPIRGVGTSTAAIIGAAQKADAHVNTPVAINNWSEFLQRFTTGERRSTVLSNAVFGFFENGGGRCFIVNTGAETSLTAALKAVATYDEVAIVLAPGFSDGAAHEALLSHCEKLGDRVAILDPPEDVPDITLLTQVATEAAPARRRGAAEGEPDASAPRGEGDEGPRAGGLRPRQSDKGFGAFYFPWLTIMDPLSDALVNVPPSGHMAGIWARTDAARGVHKPPANEAVRGALNLTHRVTRDEQADLNDAGVNCIRLFAREGIRVWGARTVAAGSSEWSYLNVRRLFNMIEESIAEGTNWIVFEPNDRTLWKHIQREVCAFLTRVWRDGALMGNTPEEAFFVKCDEETNPPEEIDAGRVTAVIGIAPVKPAEFVLFRISQTRAGAEIASGAV